MDYDINAKIEEYLIEWGVPTDTAQVLDVILLIALLGIVCIIADFLTRRVFLSTIQRLASKTKSDWDDVLVDKKVFNYLAHLAPAAIVEIFIPVLFPASEELVEIILTANHLYVIVVILFSVLALFDSLQVILSRMKMFQGKPIASYIQLFKLISYILAGILVLSVAIGKSPIYFLGAFGAMTAVVLLIFKDTILGLVASIQISANDLFREGDWVSMPKYGADGDVMAINLTTVQIRNWDQTISTVPAYAFISDSFVNWRGMQESGGRRIMRSVLVDISCVKFCSTEMVEQFKKYQLIKSYLEERTSEINEFNSKNKIDKSELINGRHLTNVGVFRRYLEEYLKKHPKLDKEKIIMVRQLEPTEKGLPIQIYAFSNDIRWPFYEAIQADIFDHILASAEFFQLELFQNPSGKDVKALINAR